MTIIKCGLVWRVSQTTGDIRIKRPMTVLGITSRRKPQAVHVRAQYHTENPIVGGGLARNLRVTNRGRAYLDELAAEAALVADVQRAIREADNAEV